VEYPVLLAGPGGEAKYRRIEVYRIPLTLELSLASIMDRSPGFLRHLIAHGREEAGKFLGARWSNPAAFRDRPHQPCPGG
jgi:hypothetical protein